MIKESTRANKSDRIFIFLIPLAIGFVSYVIIYCLIGKYHFFLDEKEGLNKLEIVLNLCGTLLGFWITALSILFALGKGKFIEMLVNTGHLKTILYSYVVCCIHLLVVVILTTIFIFLNIWNMSIFAVVCSCLIDVFVLVCICLFFLMAIIIKK